VAARCAVLGEQEALSQLMGVFGGPAAKSIPSAPYEQSNPATLTTS